MSKMLTREQVVIRLHKLRVEGDMLGQREQELLAHDAALRAEVERLTRAAIELADLKLALWCPLALSCFLCGKGPLLEKDLAVRWRDSLLGFCFECRDRAAQLAAMTQERDEAKRIAEVQMKETVKAALIINTYEQQLAASEARVQVVACEQCGLAYGSPWWVDVVIPDAIWNTLNASLLCFACMTQALVKAGQTNVPMIVASGPYIDANEKWRLIGWEHGRKVGEQETWEAAAKLIESREVSTGKGMVTLTPGEEYMNDAVELFADLCRQQGGGG